MKRKLTLEEIERLKLAGKAKHEERQKRHEEKQKDLMIKGLEAKLSELNRYFERSYPFLRFMPSRLAEAESLLFLEADHQTRVKAYLAHAYYYERIIFYLWQDCRISEKAFFFFDDVLSDEATDFSANSVLSLIDGKVDENLLEIFKRHQYKFEHSLLAPVLKTFLLRYIEKKELYPRTDEEILILKKIYQIFSSDKIKSF